MLPTRQLCQTSRTSHGKRTRYMCRKCGAPGSTDYLVFSARTAKR